MRTNIKSPFIDACRAAGYRACGQLSRASGVPERVVRAAVDDGVLPPVEARRQLAEALDVPEEKLWPSVKR
jgi:hypothetical protein